MLALLGAVAVAVVLIVREVTPDALFWRQLVVGVGLLAVFGPRSASKSDARVGAARRTGSGLG